MTDFTIADVLAWARTKPAAGEYNYGSTDNCAICQFLRETGRCATPSAGGVYWRDASQPLPGTHIPFPEGLDTTLQAGTFGRLVERLEKFCPTTPVPRSDWAKLDAYMTDIEQVPA